MQRPQWQYFYDGRDLFAVLEFWARWTAGPSRLPSAVLGVFPTRQFAVAFINAKMAAPPTSPINKGERLADVRQVDLDHVGKICRHQQQAKAHRARTIARRKHAPLQTMSSQQAKPSKGIDIGPPGQHGSQRWGQANPSTEPTAPGTLQTPARPRRLVTGTPRIVAGPAMRGASQPTIFPAEPGDGPAAFMCGSVGASDLEGPDVLAQRPLTPQAPVCLRTARPKCNDGTCHLRNRGWFVPRLRLNRVQ